MNSPPPTVSLPTAITEDVCQPYTISEHSWSGLTTHIMRTDGSICRARLGEIKFRQYGIVIRVEFMVRGVRTFKDVDPVGIACLQLMWLNVDVVSASDEDDNDNEDHLPTGLGLGSSLYDCDKTLPTLSADRSFLSPLQRTAFDYKCLQSNVFIRMVATL